MIASRYFTYTLSMLTFLLGISLYFVVPRFNQLYSTLYSNWGTSEELPIVAFHWPVFVWIGFFSVLAIILALLQSDKGQMKINAVSLFLIIIMTVLIVNWLTSYTFCHTWGCSKLLS